MGTAWKFCEKCKEMTPWKITVDAAEDGESEEPYYQCEVCAGNITIEFARGYKKWHEDNRKKAGIKNYKIG